MTLVSACSQHVVGVPVQNQRPNISLSAAPAESTEATYAVRLRWTALDPDGQVTSFRYAIDPPLFGDTTWTTTTRFEATIRFPSTEPPDPLPPAGQRVTARDQHAFVLCAIDDQGLRSEPIVRAFTSRTFVPWSVISSPRPTQIAISTLPRVTIRWDGFDPDGITAQPVSYRYRLIPSTLVNPDYPEAVSAGGVQAYFGAEAVNGFVGWDSTTADVREVTYERLDAERYYLFAVSARDDAGADETRFMTSSNVVFFKPTLNRTGPRLTVFNSFFRRTLTGGVSTDPSRILPLEIPAGMATTFFWFGEPGTGATMGGYRWALDLPDGNIADETPRENDQDVTRWSRWSLDETSITVGPFAGTPGQVEVHRLYVMGRDDIGFATLFTVELRVIAGEFDRPLLVVDDRYGALGGPVGAFPTEAEEDSFLFAVGGFPDRYTGGTSVPGAFAGLDYDTLDYRTRVATPGSGTGLPLALLGRYRIVAWYTDNTSAGVSSGTNPPPTALRMINRAGTLNTLAGYLEQGGKVFLFGEGVTVALAGGYWDQFSRFAPSVPYTGNNVLRAGSFLYDYVHMRSTLTTTSLAGLRFQSAIPYLPEFAGPASNADRSHDPRIGPGAARSAVRWAGLPRLTLGSYRGANPDPRLRYLNQTWHIPMAMRVVENGESVTDTLYLYQAENFDPGTAVNVPDGKPNAIHWHGASHGPLVWLGFPLYYFHVDEARAMVHKTIEVLERGE